MSKKIKMKINLEKLEKVLRNKNYQKTIIGGEIMDTKVELKAIEKKDNLQYMMDCQRIFQARFGEDFNKMNDKERTAFIKNHGYFIIEELVEMFRELRYHKSWKDYSDWTEDKIEEQLQKAREEYIDIIHFVINVGLALGLSSDDILKMYREKNKVNIERQENPELGYVK